MKISTIKCITNGCKNIVNANSYWNICLACYENTPDHIPTEQINLYNELKSEKK
jgi:hypothetical protein